MKIAITGGSGRIGTAVTTLALAQGHSVIHLDRAPSEQHGADVPFIQLDTTDYDALVRAIIGCDALIHLAAITSPRRHSDHVVHNNNVVSSYNALRAAVEQGVHRVCQASSINATGGAFSRWPRYDYFPLDEAHPTYNEDSYSLSKWICEQQADSIARRYEQMAIASLRIHGVVSQRSDMANRSQFSEEVWARQLWGYVLREAVARACLLAVTADFQGHEPFFIVAPDTMMDVSSLELCQARYPEVSIHGDLSGNKGFYNCQKAERMLGWRHNTQ